MPTPRGYATHEVKDESMDVLVRRAARTPPAQPQDNNGRMDRLIPFEKFLAKSEALGSKRPFPIFKNVPVRAGKLKAPMWVVYSGRNFQCVPHSPTTELRLTSEQLPKAFNPRVLKSLLSKCEDGVSHSATMFLNYIDTHDVKHTITCAPHGINRHKHLTVLLDPPPSCHGDQAGEWKPQFHVNVQATKASKSSSGKALPKYEKVYYKLISISGIFRARGSPGPGKAEYVRSSLLPSAN